MAVDINSAVQSSNIRVISFNMHGYNQGAPTVKELLNDNSIAVAMLQEHWQTPSNLNQFNSLSDNYFIYGSSAMSKCVESGMLVGRPYGGVMLLIRNDLRHVTECLYTADRCVVIRVADWIIINVYMPCKGTADRQLICQDVLDDVWSWRERFLHCKCLIGGDLNVDLCSNDSTATIFNSFFSSNCLINCDKSPIYSRKSTYVSDALNHESVIDYIFVSDDDCVAGFSVLDPDINFSDHLPITVDCSANIKCHDTKFTQHDEKQNNDNVLYLRWDHADLVSFYEYTRINL